MPIYIKTKTGPVGRGTPSFTFVFHAIQAGPAAEKDAGMAVTDWLVWFLNCLARAIDKANEITASVLAKEAFWRALRQKSIDLSKRQKRITARWI